ncbi:hypothetical protein ACQRBF_01295 [Peptoniphilaceae bacterium SGI.131]
MEDNQFNRNFKGQNIKIDLEAELKNFKDKFSKNLRKGQKISTIIALIAFVLIYYFITLPPINLHSRQTWIFFGIILLIITVIGGKAIKFHKILRKVLFAYIIIFIMLNLTSLKIFNAKNYANVIKIEEASFSKEVEELPVDKIPTLDRESSIRVGSRKMGELLDLVSQFDIDETYTQINLADKPVRVTPLKYNGILKYLFNMKEGIPGYIKVDIVSGKADLIKLENKIKISKGDYLFRNISLYARLKYPFEILGTEEFEIDEKGDPYWVIPTYKNKVGWFGALDVNGVITINASNGAHTKYSIEEAPSWIDRIYYSDDIIEQLDWNGLYQGGYFNSILGQKNVLKTTNGYNYLALKDDVYLYTGYTSVASDRSNVGFILSNLRTKETKFYPISSAEESSAMESAQGAVQEKKYVATFPLLLNIKNHPTYFLSLKDNAGLIKNYAFIDAENYQNVSIGNTVQEALNKHLAGTSPIEEKKDAEILEASGTIEDIKEVVIDGNTHYYFTLEGDQNIYVTSISISEKLPFIKAGSKIKFSYSKLKINQVINIKEL